MGEPKYSAEELSAILREAAMLSTADREQYSLTDIQRIAEQADIAPELVARAAASLPVVATAPTSWLWGAPSGMHLVRRVDRTASSSEIMEALSLVRQRLGQTGETRDVGGGLEWRYDTGYSGGAISILPDGSGTMIRIDGRADGRQFILYFGAVLAAILTGFVTTTAATPSFSAITAAVALVPYAAVARAGWNRSARGMMQRLTELADELAERLGH